MSWIKNDFSPIQGKCLLLRRDVIPRAICSISLLISNIFLFFIPGFFRIPNGKISRGLRRFQTLKKETLNNMNNILGAKLYYERVYPSLV